MTNVSAFPKNREAPARFAATPLHPDKQCVDLIERCLRQVTDQNADVMYRLFARIVDQHLAGASTRAARRPWMDEALDEILMMISLEMYRSCNWQQAR